MVDHFLSNIGSLPDGLRAAMIPAITTWSVLALASTAVAVATAIYMTARIWRPTRNSVVASVKKPAVSIGAAVLLITTVQIVVIYPRSHYLSIVIAVGFLLVGLGLAPLFSLGMNVMSIGLFALTLVLLGSGLVNARHQQSLPVENVRPYATAMRSFAECDQDRRIYTLEFGPSVFVPSLKEVEPKTASIPLDTWLKKNRIDAVNISPRLIEAWPVGTWDSFYNNPEPYGFERVPTDARSYNSGSPRFFFVSSAQACNA